MAALLPDDAECEEPGIIRFDDAVASHQQLIMDEECARAMQSEEEDQVEDHPSCYIDHSDDARAAAQPEGNTKNNDCSMDSQCAAKIQIEEDACSMQGVVYLIHLQDNAKDIQTRWMDDIAADIASQPEKCVTTMNDIAIPQGKSL
jgi:hypothetical protein